MGMGPVFILLGSESNRRRRRLHGQEKEKEKEDRFCWSEEVRQGERKGESVVAFVDVDPNWISDYRLIPDELLIVPFPVAVSNLILCTRHQYYTGELL
jgi:hypothetical protein